MSKGSRQRAMPSTPSTTQSRPAASGSETPQSDTSRPGTTGSGRVPSAPSPAPAAAARARAAADDRRRLEPEYLIKGTECLAGHERGHELDSGRIGQVPTRRATRIGFALVLWCSVGIAFVVDRKWLGFGLQVLVLWLAYSAIVQRRFGHRRRCWRTRAWRHAWGGLAPTSSEDPTRPAGT